MSTPDPEATEATEPDTCRPVEVDGETIRVRGSGEMTPEAEEALAALVRVAKAKFVADDPEVLRATLERIRDEVRRMCNCCATNRDRLVRIRRELGIADEWDKTEAEAAAECEASLDDAEERR